MRGLLSLLTVLAVTFTTAQCTTGRVGCYYNAGAVTRPGIGSYSVNDIPVKWCTHIMYSFVGISDNKVVLLDPESYIEGFVTLRSKNPKVKLLATIGGWNEGGLKYSQMVSQNSTRSTFIQSVVELLNKYSLDGFDLDWEYPGAPERDGTAADKDNFLYLVQELRVAFSASGKKWELTAAVPLTKSKLTAGYHVPELCKALDAVNVMSYDLRGSWDGFVDLQSALYGRPNDSPGFVGVNVNDGLALWEQMGCPANKLVVGVPFYGRTYTLPTGSTNYTVGAPANSTAGGGNPGPYTAERSIKAYYEICSEVGKKDSKWTKKWAEYAMCPYAYNGDQWIGYEDPKSVTIKMEWLKKKGYLGAMTWAIDLDDFRGLCGEKSVLLKTLHKYMSTYVVPCTPSAKKV